MFRFKQFSLSQDKTPMKIGTDGVLIGAWTTIGQQTKYILDIGCGTGLIALMMAQRSNGSANVDAVEIDGSSAEQAAENIANSRWSESIKVHNIDIANFNNDFKYDLIVSNPPFFNNSLLSPEQGRSVARHTISLSFADLISSVERLLDDNGRFSLILPTKESAEFERLASGRLHLWRKCCIRGKIGADYKRIMCEYRLTSCVNIEESEFAIRAAESNDYTPEYRDLTKDFYLKF